MRLLFDQNLSHRLVRLLSDLFPGSEHVRDVGLKASDDMLIWEHAKREGFLIVSKDTDFHQQSFLRGHPPKVIWVRLGNCSTAEVESLLRRHAKGIEEFGRDEIESLLVLS